MGLVIGGIWLGAREVNDNIKINRTTNTIHTIVQEMNAAYKNMPLPTALITVTDFLVAKQVIPSDMKNEWGKGFYGADIRVSPMYLRVYLLNVPLRVCAKLITAMFADADQTIDITSQGLESATITSATVWPSHSLALIGSRCNSNATNGTIATLRFDHRFPY